LHYDGSGFDGWQVQRGRRTVQGELSALLARLCGGTAPRLTAAGRTDAGVHATGQVASALVPDRFHADELRRALNALASPDLWIASAERVPDSFHPRYDATSRTYVYRVGTGPDCRSPFRARWCWPLGQALDRARLEAASAAIPGVHDFSAFAKSGQPERGVRCHVHSAAWRTSAAEQDALEFEISADRFLHRMVRYLVGALVDVAQGRRPVEELARLLANEPGLRAPEPAPPQGLFLTRVEYSRGTETGEATGQGGSE
jgi:tRNA pseudouridine38-40 synthase